jgi:putative transposase
LQIGTARVRCLIRDRDSKYTSSFDEVFRCDGMEVICTPIRAPKANAFAERWVCTVRTECLDWMLILGRRHLERVLGEYVEHYQRRNLCGPSVGSRAQLGYLRTITV